MYMLLGIIVNKPHDLFTFKEALIFFQKSTVLRYRLHMTKYTHVSMHLDEFWQIYTPVCLPPQR